jgi:murein DD-endopeptidase MepM/ murein hydrolase activator NlpD
MQHQQDYFTKNLQTTTPKSPYGFLKGIGLVVLFSATGFLSFWNYDFLESVFDGSQIQTIAELREQNRVLHNEMERLKTSQIASSEPTDRKIIELLQRVSMIENHQTALLDALKAQSSFRPKKMSLEGLEHNSQPETSRLALLDHRLGEIEKSHIALAKILTERSERNTRMLGLMLTTVSDHLVPQHLFGKAPTDNKTHSGGPLVPLPPPTNRQTSVTQDLPEVVSAAIETMQLHALLYKTLVNLPVARPLTGDAEYVSGFGMRADPFSRQPAFHAGIDLKQSPGSAILSTGNGVVIHAGPADGYGNMVEVSHAGGVSTRYGHLSQISVAVGEPVNTGQKLGSLGNTGRSTGAHLHYETRIRDQAVNPIPFLQMGERLRMLNMNQAAKLL